MPRMRPALDVRGRGAQAVEHQVHLTGDEVLQGRAGAAVGDVRDEGLRLQLEELAGEVVRGAVARRAVVQAPGVLAHELQELRQRGGLHLLRVDDDHLRHAGDQPHGDEVLLDVVVELGVHGRGDGVVHRTHEEVVPVGRGARGDARAQRAAGAALVVEHELLAGVPAHEREERAREGVGAAAGREGHDHGHGLGGPGRLARGPRAPPRAAAAPARSRRRVGRWCIAGSPWQDDRCTLSNPRPKPARGPAGCATSG
jgi:hypothetical protein